MNPTIHELSTQRLIEIVEGREKWKEEDSVKAREELIRRGVSIEQQQTTRRILLNFRRRIKRVKTNATYASREKVFIVLLGPVLIVLLDDLFMFYSGEEY